MTIHNKDKIGVGIIGLSAQGGWAAVAHVPALQAIHDFELRALSASSQDSAKAAASKYNVPLYFDNATALAQRPEVDLVIVSVKVPEHYVLVEEAIRAGKMVYCEWPLARNLSEAEALLKLS